LGHTASAREAYGPRHRQAPGRRRPGQQFAPDLADVQGALCWALIRLGRFAEARGPTERAHGLDATDLNWTINLGHVELLTGDPAAAWRYYAEAVAQVPSAAVFEQGPVADFELFIAKGWQVKASRAALARMRGEFARRDGARKQEAGGGKP